MMMARRDLLHVREVVDLDGAALRRCTAVAEFAVRVGAPADDRASASHGHDMVAARGDADDAATGPERGTGREPAEPALPPRGDGWLAWSRPPAIPARTGPTSGAHRAAARR
jgi:hypothetical protein